MNELERARLLMEDLRADRRFLHQNAELGFDLPVTVGFVRKRLEEMDYQPQECGPSGLVATVGNPGPVMLLRADMDGLPIQEESGLPFAAANGKGHLCGHDMHTAMLLGAARLLWEDRESLPGTVKLMFQPAEERLGGAASMVQAGVLERPKVNAALAFHMIPQAPTGAIIYNTGVISNSSDTLHITIRGKGGHAAQPHLSIDPISVAAHLYIALQELISREIDPAKEAVLTFGEITAGEAHNIIPETAQMRGTLRTLEPSVRAFLKERIQEMVTSLPKVFRAEGSLEIPLSGGSVYNDPEVAGVVIPALEELLGKDKVIGVDGHMGASEDFAQVSERVPSLMMGLGGGSWEEGYRYSLHHPKVTFNEESLPVGVAALCCGAKEWLESV